MAGRKATRPAEPTPDEQRTRAAVHLLEEAVAWKGHVSLRGVDFKLAKAIEAYERTVEMCEEHT